MENRKAATGGNGAALSRNRSKNSTEASIPQAAESAQRVFAVSLFNNRFDNQPKPETITARTLREWVERPTVRASKDGAAFSPAIFDPPKRSNATARELCVAALDFDGGMTWGEGLALLRSLAVGFVGHTTFSHTEDEHRFRVLIPLRTPVPARLWPAVWQWFHTFTGKAIDASCKDASRLHYLPAIASPEASYEYHVEPGPALDWTELHLKCVWRASGGDQPVTVIGEAGKANGQRFVRIKESATAIPLAELVLPETIAEEQRTAAQPAPATSPAQASTEAPDALLVTGNNEQERRRKAAHTALAGEVAKVESAPKGQRNHQLNISAVKMGHHIAAGAISETEVIDALIAAAKRAGLGPAEIRRTIQSGLTTGRREPAPLRERSNSAPAVPVEKHQAAESKAKGRKRNQVENKEPVSLPAPQYKTEPEGLFWKQPTRNGFCWTPITNFLARVTREIVKDDGAETRIVIELEAAQRGRKVAGQVTPASFAALRWPSELLGASAVVFPGRSEHAKCAISLLSGDIPQAHVFAHTGWREITGGMHYLHAGGAIGAEGGQPASVELEGALSDYQLPTPPATPEAWAEAMRAVLDILEVVPDAVSVPALGAVWDAVLGGADYSVFVEGASGQRKSAFTAVLQAFWGAAFTGDHLPANWTSTANSNAEKQHALKDALLVIDDYKPGNDHRDRARLEKDADRIFRGAANHAGRGRMNADGTLRLEKPPRCLVLASGEDVPPGHSLRARLLILRIEKGATDLARLSQCQRAAENGVYSQALAGYLQWLAPRIAELQANQRAELAAFRDRLLQRFPHHGRTPAIIARLQRAWGYWLKAAQGCGVLTTAEAQTLWRRIGAGLNEAGASQAAYLRTQEPAERFIELIIAALSSGRAYLAPADDSPNARLAACWGAEGEKIGWVTGTGEVFLQPDNSFRLAHEMARGGEGLSVSQQTLWRRLDEAGLLAARDGSHLTVKRVAENQRQRVLVLKVDVLTGGTLSAKVGQVGRDPEEEEGIAF